MQGDPSSPRRRSSALIEALAATAWSVAASSPKRRSAGDHGEESPGKALDLPDVRLVAISPLDSRRLGISLRNNDGAGGVIVHTVRNPSRTHSPACTAEPDIAIRCAITG